MLTSTTSLTLTTPQSTNCGGRLCDDGISDNGVHRNYVELLLLLSYWIFIHIIRQKNLIDENYTLTILIIDYVTVGGL